MKASRCPYDKRDPLTRANQLTAYNIDAPYRCHTHRNATPLALKKKDKRKKKEVIRKKRKRKKGDQHMRASSSPSLVNSEIFHLTLCSPLGSSGRTLSRGEYQNTPRVRRDLTAHTRLGAFLCYSIPLSFHFFSPTSVIFFPPFAQTV